MVNLVFYIFSNIFLLSSIMVIVVQSSIFALLFLVLSFLAASIILLLLECEFLGLLFFIIYVGAIAVLFLFVVMMLDSKLHDLSKNFIKYIPFGLILGSTFLFEIINLISKNFKMNPYKESFLKNEYYNWYNIIDSAIDIEVFGQILYTHYVLQFLVAGLILFLALVGVVYLTIIPNEKTIKSQVLFKQLSRTSQSFFVIKD